jgi:hypothetical protein
MDIVHFFDMFVNPAQCDIENVTQIDKLPGGTGGQNGVTHEQEKSGNAGNQRFYWYKCGSYLAELIRQNIGFLTASTKPNFHITPEIRTRLLAISGRQIDRLLKSAKNALSRAHGIFLSDLAD